jgi:hypothetical protein
LNVQRISETEQVPGMCARRVGHSNPRTCSGNW